MNIKYINAMRIISLEVIHIAKQGHVGMSMSAAPLTYALYTKHINITDKNPKWFNRDRFVLSAGHGSLAIYSLLHFAGLLSVDDMKNFKKKDSKTPGHPEYEHDNYIDASTGPLGQGTGIAVGMAIAEIYLRNKFKNLKGLIDHYTFAILGDGDIQEGISYESMSLAGKLKLNKLIFIHDSNNFQLDSSVDRVFNENLEQRMQSMNWYYITTSNDADEISEAISKAKIQDKPTFIEVKTIIGEGLKTENSNKAHSMSITIEDLNLASDYYKINHNNFSFEKDIYNHFKENIVERGNLEHEKWKKLCDKYSKEFPSEFEEFLKWSENNFDNISKLIKDTPIATNNVATRNYVKDFLNNLYEKNIDWLILGCADLIAATNIKNGDSYFDINKNSNNVLFGIREFAMSSIMNGILLHKGLKTISGTFLVFSDYMKSAIRLGALMKLPNIYIFTHDSYQVGGDGPTHQPVDQLAMLRSIPNVVVHKPCDEIEFLASLDISLHSTEQTNIIILTRHNLSSKHNTTLSGFINGGYILYEDKNPDITLAGSGSEIDLLFETKQLLEKDNIKVKIVSIPSLQKFINQPSKIINNILKSKFGLLTVEASSDNTWYKLSRTSKNFYHFQANQFGKSMDGDELYKLMGFNALNLKKIIKKFILI